MFVFAIIIILFAWTLVGCRLISLMGDKPKPLDMFMVIAFSGPFFWVLALFCSFSDLHKNKNKKS